MSALPALTERQRLFVSAYIADPKRSATAAAIKAGYGKGAKVRAHHLMRSKRVRAVIDAELRKLHRRYRLDAARVARELATVAFSNVDDFLMTEDGRLALKDATKLRALRAVASVKRKTRTRTDKDGETTTEHELEYRLWDKVRALELAAKHLGMIKPDGANVQVNVAVQQAQVWQLGEGKKLVFPP